VLSLAGASCTRAVGPPFVLKEIGPGVWAAISNPKSRTPAGANMGIIIGDDGVAVVDTTVSFGADGAFNTEPTRQLLTAIRTLTKLPVRYVINTHHHLDHAGANTVLADSGAIVIAQRNVRDWIRSENVHAFGADVTPAQRTFIEALAPPVMTYSREMELYLGSREVRVRSLPGHTGGDSVVMVPDARTVFTGDLFWHNSLPNLVDASTKPWIDSLDALAQHEAGTTFVPGHGETGRVEDVASFRDYLATLRSLVESAQASGKSGDALADLVVPRLREKFRNWEYFDNLVKPNIQDVAAEISDTKRVPQARAE